MTEARVEALAGPADLDGIIAIEEATFHKPTGRAWYEAELQRPGVCFVFVIRTPEFPVAGFCAFWRVADEIHINNLAIRPELRGCGLGRRLLTGVLEAADQMGAPRATLEVRRSNDPARRLYQRAGFRVAAVRPAYYSEPVEDALILSRSPAGAGA